MGRGTKQFGLVEDAQKKRKLSTDARSGFTVGGGVSAALNPLEVEWDAERRTDAERQADAGRQTDAERQADAERQTLKDRWYAERQTVRIAMVAVPMSMVAVRISMVTVPISMVQSVSK